MPIIGRFYNIIIKMHYIEDEHTPPHIHAQYNEFHGIFSIKTGNMIRGELPKNAVKLTKKIY